MMQGLLNFLTSPEGLDYLQRNVIYWLIGLVGLPLLLLLNREVERQKAESNRQKSKRYKRVPVVHPPKSTPQQQINAANRQRQVKADRLDEYKNRYPSSQPKPTPPTPPNRRVPIVGVRASQANRLQPKLLSLLNGDTKTAQRLLEAAKFKHPEKSEHWLFEKVIYDLERDRH